VLAGGSMKTRSRRLLETRFRDWSIGKAVATFSVAALLGLTLATDTVAAGYGGSSTINLTTPGPLPGSTSDGVFTLADCQALGCSGPPTFFVSPGATVDLLGITNFIATNTSSGPATLTINFRYQFDTTGAIPPNLPISASFGASMAGAFLTNPGSVSYTAAGFDDVINQCPRTGGDCSDSFAGGAGPTVTSFDAPSNLRVEDDILCPLNSDFGCLPLFQGTITLFFANGGDQVLIPGSFREAAGSTANKAAILAALSEVPAPPTALLVIFGAAAIACRRRLVGRRS
jgi:hypothetical protein